MLNKEEKNRFHELIDLYTGHWENYRNFDQWKKRRINQEIYKEKFVDVFEKEFSFFNKDRKILDLGSGMGGFLVALKLRGYDNIYGLEFDPNYCEITKLRAKKYDLEIPVKNCCAEKSSYSSDNFDIIISTDVIEHVQDPKECFKEIKRMLKSDGYCYLTNPNRYGFKDAHYKIYFINYFPKKIGQFFADLLTDRQGYVNKDNQKLTEMHYFTYWKIKKILRNIGFNFKDIKYERLLNSEKDYRLLKKIRLFNLFYFFYIRFYCCNFEWLIKKND